MSKPKAIKTTIRINNSNNITYVLKTFNNNTYKLTTFQKNAATGCYNQVGKPLVGYCK